MRAYIFAHWKYFSLRETCVGKKKKIHAQRDEANLRRGEHFLLIFFFFSFPFENASICAARIASVARVSREERHQGSRNGSREKKVEVQIEISFVIPRFSLAVWLSRPHFFRRSPWHTVVGAFIYIIYRVITGDTINRVRERGGQRREKESERERKRMLQHI